MGVYYSHYLIPRDNTVRPGPDRILALVEAWKRTGYLVPIGMGENGEDIGATIILDDWKREQRRQERSKKTEPARFSSWLPKAFTRKQPPRRADPRRPFSTSPAGESLVWLASTGALIEWPMHESVRRGAAPPPLLPMDRGGDIREMIGYVLQIHLSDDFVNPDTDPYGGDGPQLSTLCKCGHDLAYEDTGIGFEEYRIQKSCPSCGLSFRPQDQLVGMRDGTNGSTYSEPGGLCHRFAIVVSYGKNFPYQDTDPSDGNEVHRDPRASQHFVETCEAALETGLHGISHYS